MAVPADLRDLIRRLEARTRAPRPDRPAASIQDAVAGAIEETERGPVLVVRRRWPLAHVHGGQPLTALRGAAPECLALLARDGVSPPGPDRLLYLDTETTGLAGGTGTYAFLVGAGFVDGAELEVRQFFMRDLDEEPALLAAVDGLLRRFDGLVTYNGAGFDLPLLETRFVLGRRRWPGEGVHLDLLPAARRLWGGRLADCRLGTVEQRVLGFSREDDVPGALIPSLYFDYLRRRHPGDVPRIFEHNRHDILSLAALTGWVTDAAGRAPDPGLAPEDLAALGRLWEPRDAARGEACYRLALRLGLEGAGRERLLSRLAWTERRRARFVEARALWEEIVHRQGAFDPRPWEEMAKIDEHRRRDFATAHAVIREALDRARSTRAADGVIAALTHRLHRLDRRRQAGARSPRLRQQAAPGPEGPPPRPGT
ncbi:MAG: ribonuclease H-like domain-containing protein [Candidatus Rokubacteria bacterium]|nr:ribonuclease H-like domain-containing protein [Candidatus Rokubacteria bacterium]